MIVARYNDNVSSGLIANELSETKRRYISRNAVIGRLGRLREKFPGKFTRSPGSNATPRVPRSRAAPGTQVAATGTYGRAKPWKPVPQPATLPAPALAPAPADEDVIPMVQRCTVLDLGGGDRCKWPIGDPRDPDFFFCGGKRLTGFPYCGYHARLAYETSTERKRRRGTA